MGNLKCSECITKETEMIAEILLGKTELDIKNNKIQSTTGNLIAIEEFPKEELINKNSNQEKNFDPYANIPSKIIENKIIQNIEEENNPQLYNNNNNYVIKQTNNEKGFNILKENEENHQKK